MSSHRMRFRSRCARRSRRRRRRTPPDCRCGGRCTPRADGPAPRRDALDAAPARAIARRHRRYDRATASLPRSSRWRWSSKRPTDRSRGRERRLVITQRTEDHGPGSCSWWSSLAGGSTASRRQRRGHRPRRGPARDGGSADHRACWSHRTHDRAARLTSHRSGPREACRAPWRAASAASTRPTDSTASSRCIRSPASHSSGWRRRRRLTSTLERLTRAESIAIRRPAAVLGPHELVAARLEGKLSRYEAAWHRGKHFEALSLDELLTEWPATWGDAEAAFIADAVVPAGVAQ